MAVPRGSLFLCAGAEPFCARGAQQSVRDTLTSKSHNVRVEANLSVFMAGAYKS